MLEIPSLLSLRHELDMGLSEGDRLAKRIKRRESCSCDTLNGNNKAAWPLLSTKELLFLQKIVLKISV